MAGCAFRLWAPAATRVEFCLEADAGESILPLSWLFRNEDDDSAAVLLACAARNH